MKQKLILERLLDKYEQSVHLYHPDVSTRRVMLRVDKKEFPEYDYENASVRDEWNENKAVEKMIEEFETKK